MGSLLRRKHVHARRCRPAISQASRIVRTAPIRALLEGRTPGSPGPCFLGQADVCVDAGPCPRLMPAVSIRPDLPRPRAGMPFRIVHSGHLRSLELSPAEDGRISKCRSGPRTRTCVARAPSTSLSMRSLHGADLPQARSPRSAPWTRVKRSSPTVVLPPGKTTRLPRAGQQPLGGRQRPRPDQAPRKVGYRRMSCWAAVCPVSGLPSVLISSITRNPPFTLPM